jgi:thiopurine S-methyltransferase
MEPDFWHRRWHKNEIGFHESDGSSLLKAYFETLNIPSAGRVFVPLCGKTRDLAWLLSQGFHVVAIELNELAVIQLFEELGITPKRTTVNTSHNTQLQYFHYTFSNGLTFDVFQGDFFALTTTQLGNVDAVYDRAALVALPPKMRKQYVAHLLSLSAHCRQLLVCFEYEQGLLNGPPHSVNYEEVQEHYHKSYAIKALYNDRVEGGFRGQTEVFESVYRLSPL